MKIKLLNLFLLVTLATFLFSCKKDSSTSDYYVKFKLNGNWVIWHKVLGELGPDLADDTKTDFGVTANDDATTKVFDISIQVDGPQLSTGTYDSDNYFMFVSYVIDANNANMKGYTMGSFTGRPDSKYTVTITSITDKVIKGYFTGNYLVTSGGDETVDITEGEFVVQRIR